MKTCVCALTLCIAVCFGQKQTEVVTTTSAYTVEETIVSDVSGNREEHRSKITDDKGQVTEHVVIKIFTKRLLISYRSNDTKCIVGPLDEKDAPVPSVVFEEVHIGETVLASEGKVVDSGVVQMSAVDAQVQDMPPEVSVECGDRKPEFISPVTFPNVHGNRLKRTSYGGSAPSAPGSCGQELHYNTKCSKKTTSTCCKHCESSIPYCYKDYYYANIPCPKNPVSSYGSHRTY